MGPPSGALRECQLGSPRVPYRRMSNSVHHAQACSGSTLDYYMKSGEILFLFCVVIVENIMLVWSTSRGNRRRLRNDIVNSSKLT